MRQLVDGVPSNRMRCADSMASLPYPALVLCCRPNSDLETPTQGVFTFLIEQLGVKNVEFLELIQLDPDSIRALRYGENSISVQVQHRAIHSIFSVFFLVLLYQVNNGPTRLFKNFADASIPAIHLAPSMV